MIKEAIILAGGLGTRLRNTVPNLPKCMAPVAGRPFLFYVIRHLRMQGIEKIIFSLGYRHEAILEYLEQFFPTMNYDYVVEDEPLGTGGAIRLACKKAESENIVIVNGDTLFDTDIQKASTFHTSNKNECTLLLKPMQNFDRYGVVEIDNLGRVKQFSEKKHYDSGLINGGVYILNVQGFLALTFPEKFSFEKDYLEKYYDSHLICGQVQDEYFIDIGISEDYRRANGDMSTTIPDLQKIDKSWTLFIDRDGVINYEKKEDYILNAGEFRFYEGVEEAFKILAEKFGKLIIVTNQRGIGKGLMTETDLKEIHSRMLQAIQNVGGSIDHIYHCTSTDNKHPERKPNPGMAVLSKKDHPEINFSRSLIIGNKLSDMQFGRNAGMFTVFAATTNPDTAFPHPDIDFRFSSLPDFAKAL